MGTIAKGVHGILRITDAKGFKVPPFQARWQEKPQQPERGQYAATTGTEVAALDLDPNGLVHPMDSVMQRQGNNYLQAWGQHGDHPIGLEPPVEIELTLEGSNIDPQVHQFQVDIEPLPALNPSARKL